MPDGDGRSAPALPVRDRGAVETARLDQPTGLAGPVPERAPEWGSDVMADMLRLLGVEYAALNPGASYRGLHDSLVNYGGNERPGMILGNHEEVAVAVAHGYSKWSGRAMAAIVHSNVGLLHAGMGIFNAWVDRAPVLVLGATGPMDSTERRPWIDWIHTSFGQGEVVREFTKWEHQPSSVEAVPEAMLRAWQVANSEPCGPVYFCFDAGLQEQRLESAVPMPDIGRFPLPTSLEPAPEAVEKAARWLVGAEFPVIVLGRSGQGEQAWSELVALAEALGAAVLTDSKSRASFPTSHPLQQASVSNRPEEDAAEIIQQADVVLFLERIDPNGTMVLAMSGGGGQRGRASASRSWPKLINVSLDHLAVRSWAADFQELLPADLSIAANVERTVRSLLERVRRAMLDDPSARRRAEARTEAHRRRRAALEAAWEALRRERWDQAPISMTRAVGELKAALGDRYEQAIVAKIPLAWPRGIWEFTQPGSYSGSDGGAGVGSGPGITVGIALAALGSGRPVIGIVGDGDLLMAPTALWTAAHHQIPVLFVVANNRSYYNDEEHQERVAVVRNRPVENRWVGQRIDDPPVDFAGLARDLGAEGFGPVTEPADLAAAYGRALGALSEGRPALVDVRISPR